MSPALELLNAALSHLPDFVLTARPEVLAGGNLNQVWRLNGGHRTVILKYAPPFVATAPAIPLAPDRLAFEARALGLFAPGGRFQSHATNAVRPPRLIHFDADSHFLLMEDVGRGPDLAEAIETGLLRPEAGRYLGEFIARLHGQSFRDPALARSFNNRTIQTSRLDVQYLSAGRYAHAAGVKTVTPIEKNAAALGRLLLDPGRCLVMGDLWPPSIREAENALRLIDWEFAHFGRPLQDLAHFGAHCWIRSQTAPNRTAAQNALELWSSFIAGYKAVAGSALAELLDNDEERLMNVHAGAEILMRSVGPFVHGYRYDGLRAESPLVRDALREAVQLLAQPSPRFFLGM